MECVQKFMLTNSKSGGIQVGVKYNALSVDHMNILKKKKFKRY